jgi:hypothetical protein
MWIQAPLTPTCAPGARIAWPVRPTVHLGRRSDKAETKVRLLFGLLTGEHTMCERQTIETDTATIFGVVV